MRIIRNLLTCPTLQVTCSQGDVRILMQILHENLGEGFDPDEDLPHKPAADDHSDNKKLSAAATDSAPAAVPMMSLSSAIYPRIKVSFELQTLEAVLCNGESQLDSTIKVQLEF